MASGVHNIRIEHGSTFILDLTWTDSNGDAIDLTGFSAAMDIRDRAGNLMSDVAADGSISLGGTAGTIAIVLPLGVVNAIPAGVYRYDLLLTSGSGVGTKLLKGSAAVESKVTS